MTVAFLGAKSPKLAKIRQSQNTNATVNGTAIDRSNCSKRSTRVRAKLRAMVKV